MQRVRIIYCFICKIGQGGPGGLTSSKRERKPMSYSCAVGSLVRPFVRISFANFLKSGRYVLFLLLEEPGTPVVSDTNMFLLRSLFLSFSADSEMFFLACRNVHIKH